MSFFDLFARKADGPVWTVDAADVREIGHGADGLWRYEVVWRKGPQTMTGTYAFPSKKKLAKVLKLAQSEC
jgi:predicted secreted protein